MTTHVQIAHSKLFVLKEYNSMRWQFFLLFMFSNQGEKRTNPFSHVIIRFFGATNPYKKNDEQ
jgi:hypothetical protein